MNHTFNDYKICIGNSNNYPDKYVAYIEELYNVITIIDNKDQAADKLRPLFDKEIERLKDEQQIIPNPGSGKAKVTFAANDKIEKLRPFIDNFWNKVLKTSFGTSFVSNESFFRDWEHYLSNGRQELIDTVKKEYAYDITEIYDKPIYIILTELRKYQTFTGTW